MAMIDKPKATAKHVYEADLGPSSDLESFFSSSMLVTRTDFFRQLTLFRELEQLVLPALFRQETNRKKLLIWSAGCSDGREPYSLAMVTQRWFNNKGIAANFMIRASDINRKQIDVGIKGEYQIKVGELKKLREYDEFYQLIDDKTIAVNSSLARRINFCVEDITSKSFGAKYDIIVCTNVLLYYDKEYRKVIVKSITDYLREGGYLYVETIGSRYLKQIGFTRLKSGSHFFQKTVSNDNHSA